MALIDTPATTSPDAARFCKHNVRVSRDRCRLCEMAPVTDDPSLYECGPGQPARSGRTITGPATHADRSGFVALTLESAREWLASDPPHGLNIVQARQFDRGRAAVRALVHELERVVTS